MGVADDSLNEAVAWKNSSLPEYNVETSNLFVVDRDAAVRQLLEIHESNFARAKSGVGGNWIIPLVDNSPRVGKSSFASHYLLKLPTLSENSESECMETLSRAHIIHIILSPGQLTDCNNFEKALLEEFRGNLRANLVQYPKFLDRSRTTKDLLTSLTSVAGPVLVVLDKIGRAFKRRDLDKIQRSNIFVDFVNTVLMSWLLKKNVFLLLIGKGTFLNHVGLGLLRSLSPILVVLSG